MNIKQLMSKRISTVSLGDTLKTVQNKLKNTGYHHLLVVEDKKLCGIISDRDLFKALSPNLDTINETFKDLSTLDKKVHQIMSRKLITSTLDANIYDIISLLNQHNISCIPIVDEQQVPVGVITTRDILKALDHQHKNQ
ncbi:CBS domain-containing protein [Ghiorsea bivora]|uniref:CBS domain-containing protein n=1 Tax=Ghiorsea bivora TaxID=1485545 RepID=UPI0005715B89|nr:CBS domain-containing protein [Ghiorsea bivora]